MRAKIRGVAYRVLRQIVMRSSQSAGVVFLWPILPIAERIPYLKDVPIEMRIALVGLTSPITLLPSACLLLPAVGAFAAAQAIGLNLNPADAFERVEPPPNHS